MNIVAAIDIGGTNTVYGLTDEQGKILSQNSVLTKNFPEPKKLIDIVTNGLHQQIANCKLPTANLVGIGIGAPNGNYFTGAIEFAPNLQWKGVVALAKYFSDALGCKAVLTNDANAAALGEMIFGGAKGMKDFIFITIGTGLGSGIVVNGEMVYGHDGFAGEIGHVIIIPDGRQCGCGRKGCVETYCSATGIVTTFLSRVMNQESRIKSIDAKYIYELAQQGDKIAIDSFNYTGEILGIALANSVAYTSPEAIFLFGGLANAGRFIFEPTKKSFEDNLLNIYKGKIKILPSQLKANEAAILGAASLIWKELK